MALRKGGQACVRLSEASRTSLEVVDSGSSAGVRCSCWFSWPIGQVLLGTGSSFGWPFAHCVRPGR